MAKRRLARLLAVDRLIWILLLVCLIHSMMFVWALGPVNSDEAFYGRASQIILKGKLPVFGTLTYWGALKCYLDAPLILLFGPQDWTLRFWALVFRLLQVAMTYLILRRLLPRSFAFAGGLIMAVWASPVMYTLLCGTSHPLMLTLWVALVYVATLILFEERSLTRWFWLLGALSGAALWTCPQSMVIILPTGATACLSVKGRGRGAASAVYWFLGCLLGALPWWYYNLVETQMGTFRENLVASLAPGLSPAGRLLAALDNCYYFLVEKLQDMLAASAWRPGDEANGYGKPLALLVAAAFLIFAAWFTISSLRNYSWSVLRAWFTSRGVVVGGLSEGERAGFFWLGIVLGIICVWLFAIGVSAAGMSRGQFGRYSLPFVLLGVFFVPYCCSRLRRGGRLVAFGMAALMWLPAAIDAASLPGQLRLRDTQRMDQAAVERLISSSGARFVAGDYWDMERFAFRFPGKIIPIHLTEELYRSSFTEEYLFSREHPAPEDRGLLVFRRGSALEAAALEFGCGCLKDLSSPGYRVLLVPDRDESCAAVRRFKARMEYERQWDEFRSRRIDRLVVTDRVYGRRVEAQGELRSGLLIDRPGKFATWGPYIGLSAGRYRVRFVFTGGNSGRGDAFSVGEASCRALIDVVSAFGRTTYWRRELDVNPLSVVEAEFEVPPHGLMRPQVETRILPKRVSQPLRLVEVSLQRVDRATPRPPDN